MRVLRLARERDLDRHRAGGAGARRGATSRPTRSAARSRSPTSTRGADDPLADRAAQRRGRRHRGAARARQRSGARRAASTASPSGPRTGIDLIAGMPDSSGDLAGDAERLREALIAAGAVEVGPEAAEILRIEAGTPRFGAEMSTETMPAEAGIVEDAVDFTKGCYIGQEPVARLHYKGRPNRHLRGLAAERPGRAGSHAAPGREGGRAARQRLRLPRPRADRAGDRPPRGGAGRRAGRR